MELRRQSLSNFVPGTGFEPAHLAAPPPEDGASTNFATRAISQRRSANIIQEGYLNASFLGFMLNKRTPIIIITVPII